MRLILGTPILTDTLPLTNVKPNPYQYSSPLRPYFYKDLIYSQTKNAPESGFNVLAANNYGFFAIKTLTGASFEYQINDIIVGMDTLAFIPAASVLYPASNDNFLMISIYSGAPYRAASLINLSKNKLDILINNLTPSGITANYPNFAFFDCNNKNLYYVASATPSLIMKINMTHVNNPILVNTFPSTWSFTFLGEKLYGVQDESNILHIYYYESVIEICSIDVTEILNYSSYIYLSLKPYGLYIYINSVCYFYPVNFPFSDIIPKNIQDPASHVKNMTLNGYLNWRR